MGQPANAPPSPSTADLILGAAESLFARKGFERTTIKDIGAAAGVNPALIYYYYRDKTNLYHTILDRLLGELRHRARPAIAEASSVPEMIRGVVGAQVGLLTRHPRAAALIVRELVDHDASHAKGLFTTIAAELFRPACQAIEVGKREGTLRPDVDSEYAAISTVAQMIYFTLATPAIRILLERGDDFPSGDDVAAFGRHAAEFAIAAMSGDGGPTESAGRARRRTPKRRSRIRGTISNED